MLKIADKARYGAAIREPGPQPAAGNPNQQHTRPAIIAMAGRVLFFKEFKKAGTCTIFGRAIVV